MDYLRSFTAIYGHSRNAVGLYEKDRNYDNYSNFLSFSLSATPREWP